MHSNLFHLLLVVIIIIIIIDFVTKFARPMLIGVKKNFFDLKLTGFFKIYLINLLLVNF